MLSSRSFAPSLIGALLLLNACRDPAVTSYRVAKEKPPEVSSTPPTVGTAAPPPTAGNGMAATAVATAGGPGLAWSAPATWVSKPASSMRKATYAITGADGAVADLSITAFPGDVGGELANLNRWRGQLGLPPLTSTDVASATTRFEANSLRFTVVDFTNADATPTSRLLGAIVPLGASTWFFKLTGPDALVAAEKPAFLAFLQTVKLP